jgi:large subunit ribosomal protein L13
MSQTIRKAVKTTRPTKLGMQRKWYVVDVSTNSLGRVATQIANILTGKNKANYTKDVDMGGMVIVINASKVVLTGMKPEKKIYFRHSGAIGGIHARSFKEQMARDPRQVVYKAVSGMLPKNRHRDIFLNTRLFIFPEDHNMTIPNIKD